MRWSNGGWDSDGIREAARSVRQQNVQFWETSRRDLRFFFTFFATFPMFELSFHSCTSPCTLR
eukprot:TRINITY_DN3890_c0_g1_i1.p1 TRINITY_DN3890_c0_g1~~TRINITY_DN3890_c0_g1_i1.p1  ORF type:complete len:63 (-),score=9.56 TRINITY_DN3890_c0_g1_i1:5-193(-)